MQRWALSDQNPWMWWLKYAAEAVKAQRKRVSPDQPFRRTEQMVSDLVSASLTLYRDIRDALSEAMFFQMYGNMFLLYLAEKQKAMELPEVKDARELPFVKDALSAIAEGGYPEALARAGALLMKRGIPIPLSRMDLKEELIAEYRALLPDLARDQMRRIRGEQEIIVRYEPEKAVETLPHLLRQKTDRERFFTFVNRLLSDKRINAEGATPEQRRMLARIGEVLSAKLGDTEHPGEEVAA